MPRRVIGSSLSGRIWHMLKVIRNIIFKHPQWTLFICAVFVRTSTVFFGDFVWLDRGDIISGRAIVPLDSLPSAFFTRFADTGFYRPIITIILSLLSEWFGPWQPAYHVISMAAHAGVVVTAYRLFEWIYRTNRTDMTNRLLWRNKSFSRGAFLAALIIAVHPAAWFTIGAVSNLPDLVMSLFLLMSLYSFLAGSRWAVVYALLAIFSKETAIVLVPAYWGIVQMSFMGSMSLMGMMGPMRKRMLLWGGLVGVVVIYGVLRFIAVPEVWRVSAIPLSWDQWIGVWVFTMYRMMITIFSPFLPAIGDVTPVGIGEIGAIRVIGGIAALGILGMLGLRWFTAKSMTFTLFILLLLVSAAPALNLVPLPRFWQLNYAYLPIVWTAGLVGLGIGRIRGIREIGVIRERRERGDGGFLRRGVWLVLVFWISLGAYSSFTAGFRLVDDRALFTPEVSREPRYREGHYYLGNFYWRSGDLSRAEEHFTHASKEDTSVISFHDYHSAVINLAGVYFGQKRFEEADALLAGIQDEVYGMNRELVLYNRATIAYERGDYDEAVSLLEQLPRPFSRVEYARFYGLIKDSLDQKNRNPE